MEPTPLRHRRAHNPKPTAGNASQKWYVHLTPASRFTCPANAAPLAHTYLVSLPRTAPRRKAQDERSSRVECCALQRIRESNDPFLSPNSLHLARVAGCAFSVSRCGRSCPGLSERLSFCCRVNLPRTSSGQDVPNQSQATRSRVLAMAWNTHPFFSKVNPDPRWRKLALIRS
ncbi:hypothetical protein L1887_42087 [Cichorium endivia]|nr:hypothetical protein L1887_42087 [Cichorium endivia]